ncbi:MAG: biopolymer transporter Tol, partial [FCB group bacterium]|nr:biopolymer transporter Tol [FCB group bacterium]
MKKALISSIFITASILFSGLFAQSWYNHSELTWMSIETDHFIVHYHETSERCAREAAAVAEKIYGPITSVYQFEPNSKTHLVIQDTDDYSNGAAYYYDNKIIIWALPLDFDLRGSHRWMQNVITHEFTHIVQIQASMKYSRQVPGTYLQYMGYEDEKRDDVLYGFPNMIISYPIPGTSVPPWLAEGTAQHMYEDANFDFWDSHRDMIIRDKTVNHDLFDFHEMNTFGKRG